MIQRQRARPTHRALPMTTRSQPAEETHTLGGNSQTQTTGGKAPGKGRAGQGRGRGGEGYYRGKPEESKGVTARVKVSGHFCGVSGHYVAGCWKKHPEKKPDWAKKRDQDKPPTVTPTSSSSQDMETDQAPKDQKWKRSAEVLRFLKPQPRISCLLLKCVVNGKETNALIDSGASMFGVLSTSFMRIDMSQPDPSTATMIEMGD